MYSERFCCVNKRAILSFGTLFVFKARVNKLQVPGQNALCHVSFKQGKALCVGFSKHSGLYPQGVCILIFGKPSPQGLFLFKTAILSIVRQFCHSPNTLSLISWENIQVGAFCLVELFLGVGRSAFCLQNKIKVKGRM